MRRIIFFLLLLPVFAFGQYQQPFDFPLKYTRNFGSLFGDSTMVDKNYVDSAIAANSGGATPGIDDVYAEAQSLTTNRTVTGGANTLLHTFDAITTNGFHITSNSTTANTTLQRLIHAELSGANASSNIVSSAIRGSNTHTGTNSTNYGLFGNASGGSFNYGVGGNGTVGVIGTGTIGVAGTTGVASGIGGQFSSSATSGTGTALTGTASGAATTNIGGQFSATSATNNYALLVPTASGNVGFGTSTPSVKAILDLTSTTQGFLPPRMNTTQQDAITSPVAGLFIYNTDSSLYRFYNGSSWVTITTGIGGTSVSSGVVNTLAYYEGTNTVADLPTITANRALISDGLGLPVHSTTTATEIGYLNGVTSSIQTQLDNKADNNLANLIETSVLNTLIVHSATSGAVSAPAPIGSSRFNYFTLSGLSTNATFAAPSGTPLNNNLLWIILSDDGTPRTIGWNAIYDDGTDLPLITTTGSGGTTTILQYMYSTASSKWRFIGQVGGF